MIDLSWQDGAACRDIDPDEFFKSRGEHPSPIAMEACASCPVSGACLDHALKYESMGIWAGTSERKRRVMRHNLGIQVHRPQSLFMATTRGPRRDELCW